MTTLSTSDYAPDGTKAALSVLARVAAVLADCAQGAEGYCFIGGWVPFLLCGEHSSLGRHVGSMDVDVLLIPERMRLKSAIEFGNELLKAGFEPEPGILFPHRTNTQSARWWAREAAPKLDIRIDFMAPTRDRATSPVDSFAAGLKILGFYGTSAATHDPLFLKASEVLGDAVTGSLPIANGGAALMAKTIAYEARRHQSDRGKGSKDAYDLFYLVTAYRYGTDPLIKELLANPEAKLREEVLGLLEADFTTPAGLGTRLVCDFLTDPPGGRAEFALQISSQVTAFLRLVKGGAGG